METSPNLNINIKWKLFGAFFLAFLTPVVLFLCRMPPEIIVGTGLVFTGLLAWYSIHLFNTVTELLRLANRLRVRRSEQNPAAAKDEVTQLIHAFDDFYVGLETSFTTSTLGKTITQTGLGESGEPALAKAAHGRAVFDAGLASGESIAGEAMMLPRRSEEELMGLSGLIGKEALSLFRKAVDQVKEQLVRLRDIPELEESEKGIIEFQRLLLVDAALIKGVQACLRDDLTLSESLNTTFVVIVSKLEASKNRYIAARSADCLDLKQRLRETMARSSGAGEDDIYGVVSGKIVLCQQIYPSEVIMLYRAGVAGIVCSQSTASSHAEILMQSFNIPSLANLSGVPVQVLPGRSVLLDTLHKRLIVDPEDHEIEDLSGQSPIDPSSVIRDRVFLSNEEPIVINATINNVEVEAQRARDAGADGVGLFRSEMSYIGRQDLPDEEELYQEYSVLTNTFKGKRVTMRMLDLGSDKLAAFQAHEYEENPCMGHRSMRLLIRRTDIFRNQLRAMLRAANDDACILFPMISGWHELDKIQSLISRISEELRSEDVEISENVRYGLMVEVPSVVERFDDYVKEFDEFSIGTNDLTQYTLAADRNNKRVAEYYKSYHPSMLSMIRRVCKEGKKYDKTVCLCGEMAADAFLTPLLLGLGVRSLSVPYALIPETKKLVRSLDVVKCQEMADLALSCRSTGEVEAVLADFADRISQSSAEERIALGEAAAEARVQRVSRQIPAGIPTAEPSPGL